MTFETTMDNGYGEDLKIRGDFSYWKGFISRDRTEPDEPRGWILDESTVEVYDDLGWRSVSDAKYDAVCTYLEENMDEPYPGDCGEEY